MSRKHPEVLRNAVDRAQGELGGAGIDVLEVEQMDDFVRGLADTPNLHLSPHAAWYSTEAAVRRTPAALGLHVFRSLITLSLVLSSRLLCFVVVIRSFHATTSRRF